MNKFQKAESRRVKRYIRGMKACGYSLDYKATRRKIRSYNRLMADVPRIAHDGFRRLNYAIRLASKSVIGMREMLNLAIGYEPEKEDSE